MDFIGFCLFFHLFSHETDKKDGSKLLLFVFGSFGVLYAVSGTLAFFGLDMKLD